MAENEDLEQNQNVTENVNVSEAEKQPQNVNVVENVAETDNLAVVSYVTQNDEHIQQTENVVQIEHASENEDLDQYLVYSRNTWAYDITITVHCKLKFIADIRRVLEEEGELARFKRGCFGHYLDLPGHMQALFQAQYIHNLLLRQIRFPGASEDEMWFALGKNKVKLVLGNGGHPFDAEKIGQQLTGLAELWPTRREEKEDYWRGIDDDISKGPQFVPLKGFVGKEDRAEPSSKQLHKNKRKQYHGPDDPIKR
ncbi:hypothetical protein Q3G72_033045 [Acer saccharum]|nr:hypothetical protein Q3G72_033045 [Acer saccharum]